MNVQSAKPITRNGGSIKQGSQTRDERVHRALEEYAAAVESGQPVSKAELLAKFADVFEELAACLDSLDFIHNVAPQLGDVSPDQSTDDNAIRPLATLGDFRIVRELGRGGMGVVYEAEQLSLGRRVALKVLPFAAMLGPTQLKRFQNEARAAATLDHPHIVAIHSVGADRGVHYYAMQLIDGQNLAEAIAARRKDGEVGDQRSDVSKVRGSDEPTVDHRPSSNASLSPDPVRVQGEGLTRRGDRESSTKHQASSGDTKRDLQAAISTLPVHDSREYFQTVARLGIQAAEALDHAHQQGVIHRDVKPANLLVDAAGKLWVTDFGLARIEADANMTMTGDLLGTLRYMSPEQALAKRVVVDHRTDVYSLGVTLYELLALRPAFEGDDRQELLKHIAFDEPRRLRQLNHRIPEDLETIVSKALEKSPDDRYATAQELGDDLQRFFSNEAIHAKRPTLGVQIAKWSRRHVGIVWTALVGLLLLAVALIGTTTLINHSRYEANQQRQSAKETALIAEQQKVLALKQRDVALGNLYTANIPLAYKDWQEGNLNRMSDALIEFIPAGTIPDLRGWEWYFLASLLEEDDSILRPRIGSIGNLRWSPGGHQLAMGGSQGVKIYEPVSKKLVQSLEGTSPIAWHPKKPWLATATKEESSRRVAIWDVQSGKVLRHCQTDLVRNMSWRPDGEALAWHGDKTFDIWWNGQESAETHEYLREHSSFGIYELEWCDNGKLLAMGFGFPADLVLWSTEQNDFLKTINVAGGTSSHAMRWSEANGNLAIGMHNGMIHVWDVPAHKKQYSFSAHGGNILGLAWSPDGGRFATGGNDSLVKIWDRQSRRQLHQLAGHRAAVVDVDWSPGGAILASGDVDGIVRLWPTSRDQHAMSLPGFSSACWSPDGREVATETLTFQAGRAVGSLRVLICDAESGEVQRTLEPVAAPDASRVAWSPNGNWIGAASLAGGAYVWNATTGDLIHKHLDIHTDSDTTHLVEVRCFAWSPDSRLYATGGADHRTKIWESNSGELVRVLEGHNSPVGTVCWSPDGHRLLSADWSRQAKIWDTTTWELLTELDHPPDPSGAGGGGTNSSAWSPDSRRTATRSGAGDFVVWEVRPGQEPLKLWTARAHSSNIRSISWSPDGRRIASSSDDTKIKVWNAETGRELLAFDEPGSVLTVAWSPDSSRLLSVCGSRVRPVQIWDARKALNVRWQERLSDSAERAEGKTEATMSSEETQEAN